MRRANEEEWLAVVANTPGPVLKLVTAIGFHSAVGGVVSEYLAEQQQRGAQEQQNEELECGPEADVSAGTLRWERRWKEMWFAYNRNILAHTTDPTAQEVLRKLERLLRGDPNTWSTAQVLELREKMMKLHVRKGKG